MKNYSRENVSQPDSKEYAEHLWVKFINGDNSCFELIYKKYIDVLFRYGIQFTKDEEIVKDAIHDVFIKIYHNRTQLKKDVHPKFYLFTALKNSLYNLFRREVIFEKIGDEEWLNRLDYAAEENILASLEQHYIRKEISRLLDKLTERQREVIYYRYIEEMTLEEICILMDMNYQSVQNLIQRSLKKLRENPLPFSAIVFLLFGIYSSISLHV